MVIILKAKAPSQTNAITSNEPVFELCQQVLVNLAAWTF